MRKNDKEEISNKPLSKSTKIWFTIFLTITLFYYILAPKEWLQRRTDAKNCILISSAILVYFVSNNFYNYEVRFT